MEISVDEMYRIENKGHDMGFLKKFMMENAGAVAVRRLIEKFGSVETKNIVIFVGLGNIYPDTREITGRLTVLFLLAIYPANFNMWINDVPFNGTRLTTQGHLFRLSVQILLIIAALGFSGDLQKLRKN